ncbi:aspartate/glutamate racemase family protein [Trinickia dinghuensis]|uniref:Aspartate/glutamate racemase family protein n=1 Tax=Trinickia dinghuensis TaxID=2291023 RepID=A0A3D8JX72_9BURK|nr:aspartate/glutamate racemase family protein [Trinickia dinghuensis]RDU97402.1 aspartate/glutamate racemase family protein [Trinickia dinghuensis]
MNPRHPLSKPARPVVNGLTLGVLMLDTRFVRFPGEIGNGLTWPVALQFKVVKGATPARVIDDEGAGLLEPFIEAARELIDLGVQGITTSCGFLALFQRELSEALPVPVATSSLLQVPIVERMLPKGKRVGILTINERALTDRHLAAVGVDATTPIVGMHEHSLFRKAFTDQALPSAADFSVLEREMVDAARRLTASHPEVGAIVCECTNMPPFAPALRAATGLPVFDMVGLIRWFVAAIQSHAA